MGKICAGIVLYNPDLNRLDENIKAIYEQVEEIILVDNNSNNIECIEKRFKYLEKLEIIKNNSNLGIAKALNQIMRKGEDKGYRWVLTLDQDSVCSNNIIKEYLPFINQNNIAILSPRIIDRNVNKIKNRDIRDFEEVDKCITSGSLTNVNIWREIGGFDEIMFIDLVDFDYCKRVTINNYKILQINSVELLHEIGHITEHNFLGIYIYIKNHSGFRKYYMSRNLVYFYRKYKYRNWIISAYTRIFKLFIFTAIYEKNKFDKLKKIIVGSIDGIKIKI